jgi:uncharacterized protein YegL
MGGSEHIMVPEVRERGPILPMYLVADESWSMADDPTTLSGPTPIAALNNAFIELRDRLAMSPFLAEKAYVSVITFAGDAVCRRALTPLRDDDGLPDIRPRGGGTSYKNAFMELRERLSADVTSLRAQGYEVFRPVVFFITDGVPTDDDSWKDELAEVEAKFKPRIIAFGIGDADRSVIGEVASSPEYAFVAEDAVSPAEAAVAFANSLTVSISATAESVASGSAAFRFVRPQRFEDLAEDGDGESDTPDSEVW